MIRLMKSPAGLGICDCVKMAVQSRGVKDWSTHVPAGECVADMDGKVELLCDCTEGNYGECQTTISRDYMNGMNG